MKEKILSIVLIPFACLTLGMVSGCVSSGSDATFLDQNADALRGGALYDKWWKVSGVKEAIEPGGTATIDEEEVTSSLDADNPLYATHTGESTRDGSQTWRCKECHGWDYKGKDGAYGSGSHSTGFGGVFEARDKSASELFDAISDGKGVNKNHAFKSVLSATDIADLVKFIRGGTTELDDLVDSNKASMGDAAAGEALYEDSCANSACHGSDGKSIDFDSGSYDSEYVFNVAHGNPWETIHKIRFGQPDGAMPNGAEKGYSLEDVADILAFLQSMAPTGLEEASATRGGVLWDKWWGENGSPEPGPDSSQNKINPLYATGPGGQNTSTTWRCKECHGWDYKGVEGAYSSGSHFTGYTGVMGSSSWSANRLINMIGAGTKKDGTVIDGHVFEGEDLLSSGDVEDLALFIQEELVDDSDHIIAFAGNNRSTGTEIAGEVLFAGNCSICHGASGMRFNFKHGDAAPATEYIGDLSRDNPFEVTHKIRFGHPGSDEEAEEMEEELGIVTGHMPSKFDAGYSEDDVANIMAYCQTLSGSVERGGQAWDKWWNVDHVAEAIEPGDTDSSLALESPQYPIASAQEGSTTWRCKECHGWDYIGKTGRYSSGSHFTDIIGVIPGTGMDSAAIYDAIFNGVLDSETTADHAFGAVLGDAVARDLTNFISDAVDPTAMIGAVDDSGDVFGQLLFNSNCANCHGADGRAINFDSSGEEYVGTIASGNPQEFVHKVLYGQPGSDPSMPHAAGKYYSTDDVQDILDWAEELPFP